MKFYLPERVGNQTTWQRNRQLDLSLNRRGERLQMPAGATPLKQCKYRRPQCLINAAGSTGRCNTIWYKADFKGGVYDPRETVWTFCRAEERHVVPLEGGTVVA